MVEKKGWFQRGWFEYGWFEGEGKLTIYETVSVGDTKAINAKKVITEIFSIIDEVWIGQRLLLNEAFGIVDTITKKDGAKLLSEAFSTVDSLISSANKLLNETFSLVDTKLFRILFSEVLNAVDSIKNTGQRFLSESFQITDGIHYTIFVQELFQIVDSVKTTAQHTLNESLNVLDSIIKDAKREIAESFSITDGMAWTLPIYEFFNIVDTVVKNGQLGKDEAIATGDDAETFGIKNVVEILGISDSIVLTAIKKLAENLKIIDFVTRKIFMKIRKIFVRARSGNYEADIELEEYKKE